MTAQGMQLNIWNIYNFFLLTVTSGLVLNWFWGELILKLTMMKPRSIILLESCINLLQKRFYELLELILIENKENLFTLIFFVWGVAGASPIYYV